MAVFAIVLCAIACCMGVGIIRDYVEMYKSEAEKNKDRPERKFENRLNKIFVVRMVIGGLGFIVFGIFILIQALSA